jgi:hypothetical protein
MICIDCLRSKCLLHDAPQLYVAACLKCAVVAAVCTCSKRYCFIRSSMQQLDDVQYSLHKFMCAEMVT